MQQAVHPDALTSFGAAFDETLDDEIRVTVIATGFDKPEDEQAAEEEKAAEEKKDEPAKDPFDDIFAIFNK